MMTFLAYLLSYVASCKFSFWHFSVDCEKGAINPPSEHKKGGGVFEGRHLWCASTWQLQVSPWGCVVPPDPLQAYGNDRCHSRADTWAKIHGHVCLAHNAAGSCSRPLGSTMTLALLFCNNNKSTRVVRTLLSVLEKAAAIGKGFQSFLAENLLVEFKRASWDQGPCPQVT